SGVPGTRYLPFANPPIRTGSNPASRIRRLARSMALGSSPAMGIPSFSPARCASGSSDPEPIALKARTVRAPFSSFAVTRPGPPSPATRSTMACPSRRAIGLETSRINGFWASAAPKSRPICSTAVRHDKENHVTKSNGVGDRAGARGRPRRRDQVLEIVGMARREHHLMAQPGVERAERAAFPAGADRGDLDRRQAGRLGEGAPRRQRCDGKPRDDKFPAADRKRRTVHHLPPPQLEYLTRNESSVASVDADHDVRRLDDGVGGLALFQLQLGDGFVGDRGRNGGAPGGEHDMRRGRALLDAGDTALDDVARAEFHGTLLLLAPTIATGGVRRQGRAPRHLNPGARFPHISAVRVRFRGRQMPQETRSFQAEVSRLLDIVAHSLYSQKEIFLRELISNASDACDRLRYLALTEPGLLADDPELCVTLTPDRKAGTLTIADNGIGMSHDELIDNLGTIARSGTANFVKDLSGDAKKDVALIGQFGVGFYSAFMVADRVDVVSRKAGASEAFRWSSDGKGQFMIEAAERAGRGTTITLHLKADEKDFLDPYRIRTVVKTYSDHIALPIRLEETDDKGATKTETINAAAALWTRPRNEITAEQYKKFY